MLRDAMSQEAVHNAENRRQQRCFDQALNRTNALEPLFEVVLQLPDPSFPRSVHRC